MVMRPVFAASHFAGRTAAASSQSRVMNSTISFSEARGALKSSVDAKDFSTMGTPP